MENILVDIGLSVNSAMEAVVGYATETLRVIRPSAERKLHTRK
jgi:hypothetical protein